MRQNIRDNENKTAQEEHERLLEECTSYFLARPVYKKLFEKFRNKYAGLGHFGGSVTLTGLSAGDKRQLGGFMQRDYAENKSVTVSAALMEKALSSSRFEGLRWEEILESYFGEPLTAKKEQKRREKEAEELFFQKILESEDADPDGCSWLMRLREEHGSGYGVLMQQYREDPAALGRMLRNVLHAIAALPFAGEDHPENGADSSKKRMSLPVFAAAVTGDPHYFDRNTAAERLLFSFIESRYSETGKSELSRIEYKKRLYYEAGLLQDELSNDVTVSGMRAWRRDGTLHPGIEGFYICREPVRLTLQTLGGLSGVQAENGTIYVVENPSVFSYLAAQHPERTLICGNGQLKMAVLVLMDLLSKENVFYYAGDYDPEGLLIAQRLKKRYGEKLHLWQYEVTWYEKYHSDVTLSEERLKKLDGICLEELQQLADAIRGTEKAAYQEAMLHIYD